MPSIRIHAVVTVAAVVGGDVVDVNVVAVAADVAVDVDVDEADTSGMDLLLPPDQTHSQLQLHATPRSDIGEHLIVDTIYTSAQLEQLDTLPLLLIQLHYC